MDESVPAKVIELEPTPSKMREEILPMQGIEAEVKEVTMDHEMMEVDMPQNVLATNNTD